MAFTGSFMCTSFKVELMTATHDFTASTGDAFKIALYTNSASLTAATTAYTPTGEVASGDGYTTAGEALTNVTPSSASGTPAYADFSNDPTWTSATFTARGALIYNSSKSDKAVAVLDFSSDKTVTSGSFVIQFPAVGANGATAIIRIE